jgi:hypothetical protein
LIIGFADSLLLNFIAGIASLANRRARFVTHTPQRLPPALLKKEAPCASRTPRQRLAIVATRIAVLTPMIIANRVAARSILRSILSAILRAVRRPGASTIIVIAIAGQAVIAVGIANGMRTVWTRSVLSRWTGIKASLCAEHRSGHQRAPDERLVHNRLCSSTSSCAPRASGYKVRNLRFRP